MPTLLIRPRVVLVMDVLKSHHIQYIHKILSFLKWGEPFLRSYYFQSYSKIQIIVLEVVFAIVTIMLRDYAIGAYVMLSALFQHNYCEICAAL